MATHSSMLAWEIPWIEQPGRLQSMGSQKSWTWLATKGQTVGLHESVKSLGTTDRKVCTLLLSSMSSTKCSQWRARSIEKASLNGAVWRKNLEGTAVNAKTSSKPIYHIFSYRSKTVICRQKQQQQKKNCHFGTLWKTIVAEKRQGQKIPLLRKWQEYVQRPTL